MGLIIAIVLLTFKIAMTVLLMFLRRTNKLALDKLIKQDCLMFERSKESLEEYFLKPRDNNQIPNNDMKKNEAEQGNDEINTTRHLNDRDVNGGAIGPPGNLMLRENIDDLETIDAHTQENGARVQDIIVYNNFVEPYGIQTSKKEISHFENLLPITHVTMKDYDALTLQERLKYDKRTFLTYLKDCLCSRNVFISLFFKHSLVDPIYARVAKLVFNLSLILGINALMFTESLIESISLRTNKVIHI
jgi:hypothetical protein